MSGLATLAATPAFAAADGEPVPASAALRSALEAIVADFSARAYAAGLPASIAAPRIVLQTTPQLSYFTRRGVFIAEWSTLPPQGQGAFDAWAAAAGPAWTGPRLFEEMFHWFLIPHEMTHWIQSRGGTRPIDADRYASESEANRVAVAYWRRTDSDRARLDGLAAALAAIFARLPNPVPPGADAVQYFQINYDTLVVNPAAYGWYQLRMVLEASRSESPPIEGALRMAIARG